MREKSVLQEVSFRREKTTLRARKLKESKLSLSYMARRTFSSKWHSQANTHPKAGEIYAALA
jgi:hypothetical protein